MGLFLSFLLTLTTLFPGRNGSPEVFSLLWKIILLKFLERRLRQLNKWKLKTKIWKRNISWSQKRKRIYYSSHIVKFWSRLNISNNMQLIIKLWLFSFLKSWKGSKVFSKDVIPICWVSANQKFMILVFGNFSNQPWVLISRDKYKNYREWQWIVTYQIKIQQKVKNSKSRDTWNCEPWNLISITPIFTSLDLSLHILFHLFLPLDKALNFSLQPKSVIYLLYGNDCLSFYSCIILKPNSWLMLWHPETMIWRKSVQVCLFFPFAIENNLFSEWGQL